MRFHTIITSIHKCTRMPLFEYEYAHNISIFKKEKFPLFCICFVRYYSIQCINKMICSCYTTQYLTYMCTKSYIHPSYNKIFSQGPDLWLKKNVKGKKCLKNLKRVRPILRFPLFFLKKVVKIRKIKTNFKYLKNNEN